MNVDDFKPFPVARMGGQVDYQDPTKVVNGCALLAQMVRFLPDLVGTCFGTLDTIKRPGMLAEVTGIDVLTVLGTINPGQIPLLFGDDGTLSQESPAGSGSVAPLTPPFPLPTGARMRSADAENTITMAFSDGQKGLVPPVRLNGVTGILSTPQNPLGGPWAPNLIYQEGDLVKAPDGRWWRCTISATQPGSFGGPQWPKYYGFFSGGNSGTGSAGQWNPATAVDPGGGSAWEEWTPIAAQYLPAPDVSNVAIVDNPGAGTIAAGLDVYVKFLYTYANTGSPRSVSIKFVNTQANDQLIVGQNGVGGVVATNGGINMPRWIAEMFMNLPLFSTTGLTQYKLAIRIASVATGSPAPADSAYKFTTAVYNGCEPLVIGNLPATVSTDPPVGCVVSYVGPNATTPFPTDVDLGGYIGEFGQRYMVITRINKNGSMAPIDPNSAISVSFVGQLQLPIVTIVRDGSGNVECTVGDVTIGWIIGKQIVVAGCTGDATFNGDFELNNVQPTLTPEGILSWLDAAHASASNDETGTVTLNAGPPPVAFIPPGGPNDLQDIAAFSPVNGSPDGPFFYISESEPQTPFSSPILSAEGAKVLDFSGITITRDAGGNCSAALPDISGISVGDLATITAGTDASFDGQFTLDGVSPGTGTAGTLNWQQADLNAATATADLAIQVGEFSSVQVTVVDASGFAAGESVLLDTGTFAATGVVSGFDGVVEIASISGNVVTVVSTSVGVATLHAAALLTLIQQLPTTAPAAPQPITSISRDVSGNVQASVPDVGGYAPGHPIIVQGVPTNSFNGAFMIRGVKINDDGITGNLSWTQPPGLGHAVDGSGIGTLGSSPDILINYQDELLIAEADNEVTGQLSMSPPPNVADVYFVPSIRKYAYTRGTDSVFLFSETDDAENIDLENGSLSTDDNSQSLCICVREARTGEIVGIKQDGGYAINQSDLPPSQWPCPTRWREHGPPCAHAVGKGLDFLIFPSFWSQAGCYLYKDGQLDWLTKEFQSVWDRVNRAALATIWTIVDEQEKEVQIGLPLDGATTPSHIAVGSYIEGWGPQEVLNRYGKLITARSAIRWSIRPRATRTAAVVQRTLTAAQASLSQAYPFDEIVRVKGLVTATYDGTIGAAIIGTVVRNGGAVTASINTHLPLNFSLGDTVPVAGVTDASFDGNFEILGITPVLFHSLVIGWTVTWAQGSGPNATSTAGTIGGTVGQAVPPEVVPGGEIAITVAGDATFNGTFPVVASTANTLSWIQNPVGAAFRSSFWSWTGGLSGSGAGILTCPGVAPVGLVAGNRVYVRGTVSALDNLSYVISSIVQSDGYFTVTFALTTIMATNTASGVGGLGIGFVPPADVTTAVGNSFVSLEVETQPTDERVVSRQVLLAPSGAAFFDSVDIVSADRRTGVRGDATVGGVLTIRFNAPFDGDVTRVLITGMDDETFDGYYDEPCTATWGSDGVHSILQFKTSGTTGSAYGGVALSAINCMRVVLQDPTRLDDNGAGLDSRYTPALMQSGMAVIRWGAYNIELGGQGTMLVTPQTDDPNANFQSDEIVVTPPTSRRIQNGLRVADNEYLTLAVSNGRRPGQGFTLQNMILYGVVIFSGRRV